jgi:hypothetical protein
VTAGPSAVNALDDVAASSEMRPAAGIEGGMGDYPEAVRFDEHGRSPISVMLSVIVMSPDHIRVFGGL